MSSEILRISSQFGSGKRKCGFCIRWCFITNFLKAVLRLIVLVTVTFVLGIAVIVVVVVVIVVVVIVVVFLVLIVVVIVVLVAVVIVVLVIVGVVIVVVIVRSFRYILSMMANTYDGSSGYVPDIQDIELLPFPGKYDLVNYKIQFQDVRECAFINDSKGGVEGGVVDLRL